MRDIDRMLVKFSRLGSLSVVQYLLDAGADIHAWGDYALREASYHEHIEVVKLLLDAGADVHAYNDQALRWTSNTEVVKILEQHIKQERV